MEHDVEVFVQSCSAYRNIKKFLLNQPCTHGISNLPMESHSYRLLWTNSRRTVGARSKWPEGFAFNCCNPAITIRALRRTFLQFGNPDIIIFDNATSFTSVNFELFCVSSGARHSLINHILLFVMEKQGYLS